MGLRHQNKSYGFAFMSSDRATPTQVLVTNSAAAIMGGLVALVADR